MRHVKRKFLAVSILAALTGCSAGHSASPHPTASVPYWYEAGLSEAQAAIKGGLSDTSSPDWCSDLFSTVRLQTSIPYPATSAGEAEWLVGCESAIG
jgi:hypothetical protein